MAEAAFDWVEKIAQLDDTGRLAAIVTLPRASHDRPLPNAVPVLVLGAGIIHKVGPSRASVELARFLASAGHAVCRFDLSGIGDSDRARGGSLEENVQQDIRDAVSGLLDRCPGHEAVAVVGFCSGADNGFYWAGEDHRIKAVAMFDPTVHLTSGFHRRKTLDRLKSARSWMNIVSGRSIWLRAMKWQQDDAAIRPPEYYGLLVSGAEDTDRRAADLVSRGVRLLYCISGGAHSYCNAPEQVRESLPTAYSEELMEVSWRPDLDHILSAPEQRERFCALVLAWFETTGLRGG